MTTIVYGIANCDTIKKARKWLTEHNIDFTFHDYRKDGINRQWLEQTESYLGWEVMLNKRGTTYRQLDESAKDSIDRESAIELMLSQPAMIKRPILYHNDKMIIGFKASDYEEIFSNE
ncbi:ArsC family reductase [Alteromonas lipotrueiana]|uniref:ArsC family reductase n=1 Tax=Alteromonas lipotrueiana TaxID=2803815 RepID=UPI001C462EB4|nr:ArsC family reductase [Alteromonas lipotrueiana]|tara:strand:+ start:62 stop:415 length:354 start_codon:yes stop_codon:yes gene_type:complete